MIMTLIVNVLAQWIVRRLSLKYAWKEYVDFRPNRSLYFSPNLPRNR